ncbi:hypothetical protein L596_022047 [Steinernema carpocapsae]|uniref:Serpin domain-containing protein n=1 Tax=Steinernema carpocapsae TaxID=34508 RepID=A0A4V6XVX0_STECR|nr:hypothetical protein L596_022047 [Steinernema carpocapsae]
MVKTRRTTAGVKPDTSPTPADNDSKALNNASGLKTSSTPKPGSSHQPSEILTSPLAQAQMTFAFNFLQEIVRQKPEATACSPFSLSTSLATLHAGAHGRTKEEIGSLLKAKFDLQDDQIHSYFSDLLEPSPRKTI